MNYEAFVSSKLSRVPPTGLVAVPELHPSLFPFQRDLVTWALRRGRAAIFEDTGLGKSRQEVEWARCVSTYTGGRVLILAPLAVAAQTVREAASIGVDVKLAREPEDIGDARIVITNYDRLHKFDASAFAGVALDESSAIKNCNSKTLGALLDAFRDTPFKLCATATPAPNDYTELGTHAEFLGICTRVEMLSEFFCHDGGETQVWRLKGHARTAFWRWVSSWAALVRRPSDLGYEDGGYVLPPLEVRQHIAPAEQADVFATGKLFAEEAGSLTDRRNARKASLGRRVRDCADLVLNIEPDERYIVWCDLNAEQDALEEYFGDDCFSIFGALDIDEKERRLEAFVNGERRILLGKPSIFGFGLNLQMVARQAFVGVSDSWETYYQAVRRSWRFGQQRRVVVHIFASEVEGSVVANLQRKERDALAMAESLSAETRDSLRAEVHGLVRATNAYQTPVIRVPSWLRSNVA